ncbi:hypothetical protein J3U37_07170 [Gilliamella sp. B3172]|uniref:hypothetical protein n=1 Tax=Gilliamella sp. B3172 TaxID=2818006 RepID=UPI00226AA284|nr:hypothetical protein [Gilliamella sp. B3172]MCX8639881.1 hypothetical protein [Gilliamella sp. B3172]
MKIIFRVNKEKIIKMQWGLHRGDVSVRKEEFMNEVIQNDKKLIVRVGTKSTRDLTFSFVGYKN